MEFLERLNSEMSLKSVIPFFDTTLVNDNITFLRQADHYLTKFPIGVSEIYMDP